MDEIARARSALHAIDAGCPREQWVRVGMAAKSAGLSFEDFHAWSQDAGNYVSERDCLLTWNSFSEDGPIKANTLYAMAFASGWKDPFKRLQAANGGHVGVSISAPRKAAVTPIATAESDRAVKVWELCEPATQAHPYIVRKRGSAEGLRVYPQDAPPLVIRDEDVRGWLVTPCRDLSGKLLTLQFVPAYKADKLNLPGCGFGDGTHVVGEIGDCIYIVEGISQAWAVHGATGCAAAVCFGAGRLRTVAAAVREKYPAASLVLVPDRGKETQSGDIARALNCQWVELPQHLPANADVNDFSLEQGTEALAALLKQTKKPPMRFQRLSAADLANAPPLRWLVRGALPAEGLAALYGPSGSGKSFLVLDLAAAVAGAADRWFARRVTHVPITYAALEGEAGLSKRLAAWSQFHKKPIPGGLGFITHPFDLLIGTDVDELGKNIIAAGGSGGMVVIDTLNRSAPGVDENSSVAMGNLISAAKRLQSLVGGLVLLVHHTGKDATKGLRGHSSLYAALDAAIEVSKTDARREWSIAKSKDDETGAAHAFRLEIITLGLDEVGDVVTSCAVFRDETREQLKLVVLPRGGNQLLAMNALAQPLRNSKHFGKAGAIPGRPCLELEEAVRIVAEQLTVEPRRRNERAREALTGLIGRGIYSVQDGWLSRCD